jgi:hypothetical protein
MLWLVIMYDICVLTECRKERRGGWSQERKSRRGGEGRSHRRETRSWGRGKGWSHRSETRS